MSHQPKRGDDVEAWIKNTRDKYDRFSCRWEWTSLDDLLDDYRLHADAGVPLDTEVNSENGFPDWV